MQAPERFLCDGMLGSVARWLRLLGFDASYAGSTASDDEVLAAAAKESRFVLSMDTQLIQRAMKRGLGALLLKQSTKEEQVLLVLMHTGVHVDPERFFTRCTECGALLDHATLEEVREKVPDAVAREHTEYWRCPSCAHVYWHGSHVSEIERRVLDLVRRASGA